MIVFLKNQGVEFRLNTRVKDIATRLDSGTVSISAIRTLRDRAEETIAVSPKDIVIISLGSTTSGSSSGTNNDPPSMTTMEAENELDENWSIWLDLATQNPSFGDPYNFCTRTPESRLESFTVTLKDPEFFTRFINLTHDRPGLGTFVSLKDSNWMISICIPRQPFFSSQPENITVFWGYGLRPGHEGNFVRKPMLYCSGQEIMTELLLLLGFPSASILGNSITIPCVMPRRTASMLPRTYQDRPNVIPDGTANLAVIGQFVDIPDETTVSLDYSVRGAQLAVGRLMGFCKEPVNTKILPSSFSRFWNLLST
jgi:Myosin-crossreactive antigen